MKKILLGLSGLVFIQQASSQIPAVSNGSIKRIENFQSKFVTARNIDVLLPEGYNEKKKYAVLYMHDGQMLYDASISWNRSSWEVDSIISKLYQEHKIREVIVVGIWNGGVTRHADYFPQKAFELLTAEQKASILQEARNNGASVFNNTSINSDNYLQFIVTELKPVIDAQFSTLTNRKNTFVAGSSMGGLISLYAICEYPEIFSGAACLSTHWPGIFVMDDNPVPAAFIKYLQTSLPDPRKVKIYFDYGDQTLDSLYPPLQKQVDQVMRQQGFTEKNWITQYFPGEDHSETAWSKRLEIPLVFLLKK